MEVQTSSLAYNGGCVKMVVVKNEQKAFGGIDQPLSRYTQQIPKNS